MQKIERDDEGFPIQVKGMHDVPCPDCNFGEVWEGDGLVSCDRCGAYGRMWEADNPAPLSTKRCPKCAGIGWVLPHTALEHCELCDGIGRVEVSENDD